MNASELEPRMIWDGKAITSVDHDDPHVSVMLCWLDRGRVMRGRYTFMQNEAVAVDGFVEEIVDADVVEVTGQLGK